MNKLNKIFLIIIIVLVIAFSISTYYAIYYRNGYVKAVNEVERILNQVGGSITTTYEDDGNITTTFGGDNE